MQPWPFPALSHRRIMGARSRVKAKSKNPILAKTPPRAASPPTREPPWDLALVLKVQAERRALVETARQTLRPRP